MYSYENELEVQQGEDFPLDRLISQSNEEYIPFIVSSERQNPMITITVASTKFEKNERYVATWWLDLLQGDEPLPRFYQTVVQPIGEYDDETPITRPDGDEPMECLYQYTLVSEEIDEELGHKPYHYVYFTVEDPNTPQYDYEFRVRMQFRSEDTSRWGSQNYLYQITLVDTISMADYIQEAYEAYPNLQWKEWITTDDPDWEEPIREEEGESEEDYLARVAEEWRIFRNAWIMDNVAELYTFIKNRLPNWFQVDIDVDSPAGWIGIPQVIMQPTKLQVNNNLRKLI